MALWIPGFEIKDAGFPDGGYYDEYKHPKFVWHTWEGTNFDGAESAFRRYPPHAAVSFESRRKVQYIPLERHAYALAGSENDNSYCIQIEVAGFAAESHNWSQDKLKWLGEEVVRPICRMIPIPNNIPPKGFLGQDAGFILASARSPLRFSLGELDAFSGHCGHQHMPAPDSHWDPGKLPIASILKYAFPGPTTPVEVDMPEGFFFNYSESSRNWYSDWLHYREVSNEDMKDIQATNGGKVKTLTLDPKQVDRMKKIGA